MLPNAQVPAGRVYKMSTLEIQELKRQLQDYTSKNWIRVSQSMYAASVLFARKANGQLSMCIDYRQLNRYTKRVEFPLLNIGTILDTLGESKIFSALDLTQGYHQVRIHEVPDIHKTAFKTQFGLFEFTVLPFGLTAAPSTFQRLMNHVLQPHEKDYAICYLDDILIHSKTQEYHLSKYLREILTLLAKKTLRMGNCSFALSHLDYLGHAISVQGIQQSNKKI